MEPDMGWASKLIQKSNDKPAKKIIQPKDVAKTIKISGIKTRSLRPKKREHLRSLFLCQGHPRNRTRFVIF